MPKLSQGLVFEGGAEACVSQTCFNWSSLREYPLASLSLLLRELEGGILASFSKEALEQDFTVPLFSDSAF